jgi:LacI family transcriptional regulator
MTVSRVINGEGGVRPLTRQAVEAAIRTLNYAPNPMARALSGAEHVKIALVHRFPSAGHLGDFLAHLLDATTRAHAGLVVCKVDAPTEDAHAVAQLVSDGVRAVILAPPLADDDRLVSLLCAAGMAMVAIGSTRLKGIMPAVGIDDRAAAQAMTAHLIAIGHRRIGFVKGHPNHASTQARLDGYAAALGAVGLVVREELVQGGRYDYLSGLDAADRLLDLSQPPTAIFASNDEMAAAAVAAAHRRGIDVPADLTVCGFDDTPLATTIWPALTTVRQPTEEMTRLAVDLVLRARLAEDRLVRNAQPAGGAERRIVLDHLIIRRQSDASPRRRPGTDRAPAPLPDDQRSLASSPSA